MGKSQPKPQDWAKGEFRKRVAEIAIMFAWVLPVYNKETREVFNLTFKEDIAKIIPGFFRDLSLHSIKYPELTKQYLLFIRDSCNYALEESDTKPAVKLSEKAMNKDQLDNMLAEWINGLPK